MKHKWMLDGSPECSQILEIFHCKRCHTRAVRLHPKNHDDVFISLPDLTHILLACGAPSESDTPRVIDLALPATCEETTIRNVHES